jgi:hypothetical protein
LTAQDSIPAKEIRKQQLSFLQPDRPWTIEIPVWIPGFSGNFSYGSVELEGEDGLDPIQPIEPPDGIFDQIFSRLFKDEWYLRFFFLTKVAWEKHNWMAQFDGLYGSVGESVKFKYNNQTVVQANYRSTNLRAFLGYRIVDSWSADEKFRYELFGYAGTRFHIHKIYSDLDGLINRLDINPWWMEPIIGFQNQFTWNRWYITVQGDYGGYFIRSKRSTQFTLNAYYRMGRIISAKMGWNHIDINHKGDFRGEGYTIKTTFSGPSAGVAFHF